VFGVYFEAVPGASLFRYPEKFFGVAAMCLPLLAAVGLDAVIRRDTSRSILAWLVGLAVLLGVAWLVIPGTIGGELSSLRPDMSSERATDIVGNALEAEALLLAGLVVCLVVVALRARRWLGAAFCGAVTLQLLIMNASTIPTAPSELYSEPPRWPRRYSQTAPMT
jgi:hypothetical protein